MSAKDVSLQVSGLRSTWAARERQMKEWYQLLRLFNNLRQDNMESVISPDPRTGFNMATWLLNPRTYNFSIAEEGVTDTDIRDARPLQDFAALQLRQSVRHSRTSLFGDWISQTVKLMLATGWYATMSFATERGWIFSAWNPASVWPEYDDIGRTVKVARGYNLPANQVAGKIRYAGWNPMKREPVAGSNAWVENLWFLHDGLPFHAVNINGEQVKPPTVAPFAHIPIYTGPVAGLPDDGTIMGGKDWTKEVGSSVVAAVIDLQHNYNKILTYQQQLIRDTANPRWVEKVVDRNVLTQENLYKRGAIFSIQPGEDVLPLPTPGMPLELRTHLFDLRTQLQRGFFPDASFGAGGGVVSAFAAASTTAATQQTLNPFHMGLQYLVTDIAVNNFRQMRNFGLTVDGAAIPPVEDILEYVYEVEIPGDFMNRVQSARVVNPEFTLSSVTLIKKQFPEIGSAQQEFSRIQSEQAIRDPRFQALMFISEMERAAAEAEEIGDTVMAQRFMALANSAERTMLAEAGVQDQTLTGNAPGSGLPPELQGLTRQVEGV